MAVLHSDQDGFTVIVRMKAAAADVPAVLEASRDALSVFARQPGFVSGHLHKCHEPGLLISYLQWRSQADHEACQANPDVARDCGAFMRLLEAGKLTFAVETFDVVHSVEA